MPKTKEDIRLEIKKLTEKSHWSLEALLRLQENAKELDSEYKGRKEARRGNGAGRGRPKKKVEESNDGVAAQPSSSAASGSGAQNPDSPGKVDSVQSSAKADAPTVDANSGSSQEGASSSGAQNPEGHGAAVGSTSASQDDATAKGDGTNKGSHGASVALGEMGQDKQSEVADLEDKAASAATPISARVENSSSGSDSVRKLRVARMSCVPPNQRRDLDEFFKKMNASENNRPTEANRATRAVRRPVVDLPSSDEEPQAQSTIKTEHNGSSADSSVRSQEEQSPFIKSEEDHNVGLDQVTKTEAIKSVVEQDDNSGSDSSHGSHASDEVRKQDADAFRFKQEPQDDLSRGDCGEHADLEQERDADSDPNHQDDFSDAQSDVFEDSKSDDVHQHV